MTDDDTNTWFFILSSLILSSKMTFRVERLEIKRFKKIHLEQKSKIGDLLNATTKGIVRTNGVNFLCEINCPFVFVSG